MSRRLQSPRPAGVTPSSSGARRSALAVGLALTLALPGRSAASTTPGQDGGPPPTPVVGVPVVEREVVRRERVIGSLRARRRAELAALEEGPVVALAVREGQAVAAGDELVRIDTRRLEAERAAALAELAAARATLVEREAQVLDAREDVERFEQAGEGAVSRRELERARTALAVAEAQRDAGASAVTALEARVELLDVRLGDASLEAPFDAVVVARHTEEGEWVRPGDLVVTLVSADDYEVWLDVPERLVGSMRALQGGLAVRLEGSGAELRASAPRVVPDVDPVARTFTLVADVEDAERQLAPGLSVSAWLPVGRREAGLVVPKDALVQRAGGTAVLTVPGASVDGERTGPAVLVPVRVAFELDREVVLAPGAVEPGALVVTEGNERTFPGTPVTVRLADDTAAGGTPR